MDDTFYSYVTLHTILFIQLFHIIIHYQVPVVVASLAYQAIEAQLQQVQNRYEVSASPLHGVFPVNSFTCHLSIRYYRYMLDQKQYTYILIETRILVYILMGS